jgi:Protein of unknown function (DUF3108)
MRRALVGLALCFATGAFAETPQKLISVFGPGEQTTYEVSYVGIVAGRAQLTVGWKMQQFGHEVWPLVCSGETTQVGLVWPIHDRFISYWDPMERRTVGSDFFVDENKKKRKERYTYDLESKQAIVTRQSEGREPSERRFDIEQGTLDLAAAGFGLRNTPLVAGAVHDLPIFTGVKFYRMKATVVGREKLESQLGDVDVYRVTVNGDFNGNMKTQGLITLFYTADDKQLPVRAEAEFGFGKVRIDAVGYLPGHRYTGEE